EWVFVSDAREAAGPVVDVSLEPAFRFQFVSITIAVPGDSKMALWCENRKTEIMQRILEGPKHSVHIAAPGTRTESGLGRAGCYREYSPFAFKIACVVAHTALVDFA